MSTLPEHDALALLGLDGLSAAPDAVQLEWSQADDSHALGVGDVVAAAFAALASTAFVGVPFADVRDAALGRLDVAVSSPATRVLRVAAPAGVPLHVRVPDGRDPGEVSFVPDEDPGTAYLDMSQAVAMVVRAGTDIVLLRPLGDGVLATALAPSGAPLGGLATLPAVAAWAASSLDHWLVEQVSPLADTEDAWSRVVAAGMLARLPVPSDGAQARAWVDAVRRGEVDEGLAAPRRWARSLSEAEAHAIAAHAVAECAALCLDVEDAASDVDGDVDGWEDAVREVAYRRDDLEGVLVLLDVRGADGPLRSALAAVDREGALLRDALRGDDDDPDERLRRAALKSPGAWWGLAG